MNHQPSMPPESNDGLASAATSIDPMFKALSHRYRRCVLKNLTEETSADLNQVANILVESTHEDAVDEAAIKLHHVHLPKLEQVGLVEYHAGERTVCLTERATVARKLLPSTESRQESGSEPPRNSPSTNPRQ